MPDHFQQLLNQTGVEFHVPHGYTPVPVRPNGDVLYDYAVKSDSAGVEIRYRIWPIKVQQKNANKVYTAILTTMGMNISNGIMLEPNKYPSESAKKEFAADAEEVTMVTINSDFGKGYKLCMISVIHKQDVADVYTFYLYNTPNQIMHALRNDDVYYALTFK